MAEADRFRQVGDDFKLTNEVLVVVTDADGGAQPQAVVFWREGPDNKVTELEPNGVEDALDQAKQAGARLGREVVVQLDNEDVWFPDWGMLNAA